MKHKLYLIVLLLAACCAMAQSQQGSPGEENGAASPSHETPAPALTGGYLLPEGEEQGEDNSAGWSATHVVVPPIIGGYGSSMAIGEEMERSNYVRGGLTLQGTYDDNPYAADASSSGTGSNYAISIFPQIALDQSRSRVRWVLNYAGGFTFNQKLSQQNQTSQNFNFDLQYRLSPHVSVRATQVITLTTGLFGPVNSLNGTAPGVPQGSNAFVLTPLAKQFDTVTRGEIGYQFSGTDIVGASGGFNTLQYRDVSQSSSLLDTHAENGSGFYMHRVNPANWLGASYSFQHLGYPDTVFDTIVHSVIGFDSYAIKRTMTLTVFGGPQYSENRFPTTSTPPETASQTMWSVAGGATFGWTAPRTSVQVGYSHSIADGGGVQSSVQLNSVTGSLRRQLSTRTSLTVLGSYATNDALTPVTTGTSSSKYASGGFSITRQLGTNYFLQAGYTRQSQQITGSSTFGNDVRRDLVMASFSYQFARPWGQ